MRTVHKSEEDSYLVVRPDRSKCVNGSKCKGVTAKTVHGESFGFPLDAFHEGECVLCVRAAVSRRWYEILFRNEFPDRPIHPWIVQGYDPGRLMGPVVEGTYVGVVGPFPRYDETILRLVEDGFEQICMDPKTIPGFGFRDDRPVGARPLGFGRMYGTQFALVFAGFVSRSANDLPPLASFYKRCVSGTRTPSSNAAWFVETKRVLSTWLESVVGTNGPTDAKSVITLVRDHAAFLVSKDSPELLEAVRRRFPEWDEFVSRVREEAREVRAGRVPKTFASSPKPAETPRIEGRSSSLIFDDVVPRDSPFDWYVCSRCHDFKSIRGGGGCVRTCVDLETNEPRCKRKRSAGKNPTSSDCYGPVEAWSFDSNVVHEIGGSVWTACALCRNSIAPFSWSAIVSREPRCDACVSIVPSRTSECDACGKPVPDDGFEISTFDRGPIRYCRKHTYVSLKRESNVWSYEMLSRRVLTKRSRRS